MDARVLHHAVVRTQFCSHGKSHPPMVDCSGIGGKVRVDERSRISNGPINHNASAPTLLGVQQQKLTHDSIGGDATSVHDQHMSG